MRQRPTCDLDLAGEPDILFPPHVIEDVVEHADRSWACADPVMQTNNHHPRPLRAFFIRLIELVLQQQIELCEVVDMEHVAQIVEMRRVRDCTDLAHRQGMMNGSSRLRSSIK